METQTYNIIIPGKPDGLKIINSPVFRISMIIVPRSDMKNLAELSIANNPGVYILFGEGTDPILEDAYIGKSSGVLRRLDQHDLTREDDSWNYVVFFVGELSASTNEFLESELYRIAKESQRYLLLNKAIPPTPSVTDVEKIVANNILKQIKFLLTMFDYPLLEKFQDKSSLPESDNSSPREYFFSMGGTIARAINLEGKTMKVLQGSLVRKNITGIYSLTAKNIRERLIQTGILIDKDEKFYEFSEDFVFKSPSGAAVTIYGSALNGWLVWKDEDGNTFDDNSK